MAGLLDMFNKDTEAEIDELVERDELEQLADEIKSAYRITGIKSGGWAMEHLRSYVTRQAEIDLVAEDRIAAVKAWQDKEKSKLQGSVDYFTGLLKTWHMDQYAADPKAHKKISFPDGVLKHTIGSFSVDVDEAVFLPYAEEKDPDLLRRDPKPNKKAIAERCKDGEIIPGITYERGEDKFDVKPIVETKEA